MVIGKVIDIFLVCGVCDVFGIGCIVVCVVGGFIDFLCDICVGLVIGICFMVSYC